MAKKTEEGKKVETVEFVREGNIVIMPEKMSHPELRKWSERAEREEEEMILVHEDIACFPLDGAAQFKKAAEKHLGCLMQTETWMGPAVSQTVQVGPNPENQIVVPWGKIEAPALGTGGYIFLRPLITQHGPLLQVYIQLKKKNQKIAREVIAETKRLLKTDSIYKGKCIRPKFNWIEDGNFDPVRDAPEFIDLTGIDKSNLIYTRRTLGQLDRGLFLPINKPAQCRKYSIPLKRSVLLTGTFGVGKTLAARAAAVDALKNGWTFIHCDDAEHISHAYRLAASLAPAIVFCEDIDRSTGGERDTDLDEILNTIDGVDMKTAEVMLIMTTNDVNSINPAMLRPGRIDSLVEIELPDEEAAEKLIRLYGSGLIDMSADLTGPAKVLAGQIPSMIAEVLKRAKYSALARRDDIEGNVLPEDIVIAASEMTRHMEMVAPKPKVDPADLKLDRKLKEGEAAAVSAMARILGVVSEVPEESGLKSLPEYNGFGG